MLHLGEVLDGAITEVDVIPMDVIELLGVEVVVMVRNGGCRTKT